MSEFNFHLLQIEYPNLQFHRLFHNRRRQYKGWNRLQFFLFSLSPITYHPFKLSALQVIHL
jgi:hypothetical protein